MKRLFLYLLGAALVLLIPLPGAAQSLRFEVGQHLRAFEMAWEKHGDNAAGRKRTIRPLFTALQNFFAARWGQAAEALDQARHALKSSKPVPESIRWAESLYLAPASRLVDTSADTLQLQLKYFYTTKLTIPPSAHVDVELKGANGGPRLSFSEAKITSVPLSLKLPLKKVPAGDHVLHVTIKTKEKILASARQTLSFATKAGTRVAALGKTVDELNVKKPTTDRESVRELSRLLSGLVSGRTYETNYPAARLLAEAEATAKSLSAGKRYYGNDKTGQFWLRLKTKTGANIARVFIPEAAKKGKPLPLVVALHGAGGSENLFFDGYGRGRIVELCKHRGWLLVAPRSPTFAFRYPAAELVDVMANLYPVDRKRVFVVGHSMGAAQAVSAAQSTPKLFAAVAALGGSGRLNDVKKIKDVPFFVGVGDRDFALEGARRLADQLKKGGVREVRLRTYADVEHIVIVQAALAEVFAFFDGKAN